jgi:ribonuclease VapC
MVIDSSALIALLLAEPDSSRYIAAVARAQRRMISAPSYLETAIVMMSRSGPQAQALLDRLLAELAIEVVPFTHEQGRLAVAAFQQYGKGTGNPASLNFGDCFTYALAKLTGDPVLYKGEDFSKTDLVGAG